VGTVDGQVGLKTLDIAPGSQSESATTRASMAPRDEQLDGEIFYSLAKTTVLIEA